MARTLKDAIIDGLVKKAILDWLTKLRKDKHAMNILSGYSTYIVIIMLVILNALNYLGIHVPGFESTGDIGNLVGTLLALWRARAGGKTDAAKALVAAQSTTPITDVKDAKSVISSVK